TRVAAVTNVINFSLDFNFQYLYTIISCGFFTRPHIHEKWKRENRKMAAKKKGGSKKGGKKKK
ncbi:MAG TPA: hypothetical protein VJA94_23615, partial [Candidatus Angelobacter sp.]